MIYNYSIDGVKVFCEDQYITEESTAFRVQPKSYCLDLENISSKSRDSLNKIKWLIKQYKCSAIYHKKEPLQKGDCLDCDNPILVKFNNSLEETYTGINALNDKIVIKDYFIQDTHLLVNNILGSLRVVQDILSENSWIITDAFYIEKTIIESFLDNVFFMVGLSFGGVDGQISWLAKQLVNINLDLIKLEDDLVDYNV